MMSVMDAETLLEQWLTSSALRPSTQAEYQRELAGPKGFLTWCATQQPPIDALTARPADIATWAHDCFLRDHLNGHPFDGPDALAWLAQHHPEAARSHDRRITALTMYYRAATDRGIITIPPNLAALRSGAVRPTGARNRLDRNERAALYMAIGSWGPHRSQHWQRDRLAALLLLEGLRPAEVVRVDMRHLNTLPDLTTEVRAPDYDYEALGKPFTLHPMTTAALQLYLAVRPQPADPDVHVLLLSNRRGPLYTRWPNDLIGELVASEPLLATREPPVTADTIAHTGLWDTPE
jgi:integrase